MWLEIIVHLFQQAMNKIYDLRFLSHESSQFGK